MNDDRDDAAELPEETEVSKSERKRQSHALQELGRTLIELPAQQLATVPLDDVLAEAVALGRRINQHGARKRHLQYLGKLLRQRDTTPIEMALNALEQRHRSENARFHRVEKWRDRLIEEADEALGEFLAAYPDCDRQHLRQLIRNARQERDRGAAPKAARELFKVLREIVG